MKKATRKLVCEIVGSEPYEYYAAGRHIVVAPGVCGGRPTFKYTRIDVRHALRLLAAGRAIEEVAKGYEIPVAAVREALTLAAKAFWPKGADAGTPGMIILDEELQGLGLEAANSRWYRGAVLIIKQLRPGTVIKDEAIPALRRHVKQPTFVTINHTDFWRRLPAEPSFV